MRLHLIQGIALSLSDTVHGEQVDLQILLGLELLAAHVARDVLGLHGVNVDNVLLQIGIIRIYLAAFGTLRFTVVIGVIQLCLLMKLPLCLQHRDALNLVLRAGLQHQIQLVALPSGVLLKTLEIILQFLMHHRELFTVQAVEGIKGVLLRRLLAGGVMMMRMMLLMMMLKEG